VSNGTLPWIKSEFFRNLLGSDLDGRRYTIAVGAKDNAGNAASKSIAVVVPHDQRH
jgi:hypothetical protein